MNGQEQLGALCVFVYMALTTYKDYEALSDSISSDSAITSALCAFIMLLFIVAFATLGIGIVMLFPMFGIVFFSMLCGVRVYQVYQQRSIR